MTRPSPFNPLTHIALEEFLMGNRNELETERVVFDEKLSNPLGSHERDLRSSLASGASNRFHTPVRFVYEATHRGNGIRTVRVIEVYADAVSAGTIGDEACIVHFTTRVFGLGNAFLNVLYSNNFPEFLEVVGRDRLSLKDCHPR